MRLEEEGKELAQGIFSFWKKLKDADNGGFYGRLDSSLRLYKEAEKGVTLTSRILYFFSEYYLLFKDEEALALADEAFRFLLKAIDPLYGGIYWMLDYKGKPIDKRKVAYNASFALYASSFYYEAGKKKEAKEFAKAMFDALTSRFRKLDGSYMEEANEDFSAKRDDIMSENGVEATYSMNLLLHLVESYSAYFRFLPSIEGEKALREAMSLFTEKVYNKEKERLEVFFSPKWESLIDLESFGHEIEASWLLLEAAEALKDKKLLEETKTISSSLASAVKKRAYSSPFIANEMERGEIDATPIWWVEAEAVNGYLYQYLYFHNEGDLAVAKDILGGIKKHFIDPRKGGEWFYSLLLDNEPDMDKPIVEPWKCPYHNGRMCFELIEKGKLL